MRSRTAYCPHGFLIPGKPEPWTMPVNKGGADLKASRFCLRCWEAHGHTFLAYGCPSIETEDRIQYGFLDIIHFVLKDHAYYRDQDRYEFHETELRMHLLEKRAQFDGKPDSYVRVALRNKLVDLQRDDNSEHQIEKHSDSYEDAAPLAYGADGPDSEEPDAAIIEAIDPSQPSLESARNATAKNIVEANYGNVRFNEAGIAIQKRHDPKDPESRRTKKTREQDNAELVRAAIEEQGHRLDALTIVTKAEQDKAVTKAHREVLSAISTLPADEQMVIRLRFLKGSDVRDGKPRSRADILRELRINGNGCSRWSEWDLRTLEQQAVIRLRSKVTLPAIFKNRD